MKRSADDVGTEKSSGLHKFVQFKRAADASLGRSWTVEGKLGSGVYGTVYAIEGPTTNQCALKLLAPMKSFYDYQDMVRESYGLSTAGLLYSIAVSGDQSGFIMPRYGTRLAGPMCNPWNPELVAHVMKPVVDFLAGWPGIHRDIKPQNILLKDGHAILVDFSLCTGATSSRDPDVVTLWFRAPEIIIGQEYTNKVDVFSLGLVMYHLLTGVAISRVRDSPTMFLLDLLDHLGWPIAWPNLYKYLLQVDSNVYNYQGRAGCSLPYLRDLILRRGLALNQVATDYAVELITKMIAIRPEDRYTWAEVVAHPFWSIGVKPQPFVSFSISAKERSPCIEFLSNAKIYSRPIDIKYTGKCSKTFLYHIDHLLYYSRFMKFSDDTAVKAYFIHMYAINCGLSPTVRTLSAALFCAASYNEDLRTRKDLNSWAAWIAVWHESIDSISEIQQAVVQILVLTGATWPTWCLQNIKSCLATFELPEIFKPWMIPFLAVFEKNVTNEAVQKMSQYITKMLANDSTSIVCKY